MSWNYCIVRYRNGEGFGLHEVFYDDDGLPWGMTEKPAAFVSGTDEGPAGIKASLLRARVDAIKRPVFDEPEEGKWPGKPPAHEESQCADETPAQLCSDPFELLKEARQYVADAGCDESSETQRNSSDLLVEIDALLDSRQTPAGSVR
jgi:hypothetical protein